MAEQHKRVNFQTISNSVSLATSATLATAATGMFGSSAAVASSVTMAAPTSSSSLATSAASVRFGSSFFVGAGGSPLTPENAEEAATAGVGEKKTGAGGQQKSFRLEMELFQTDSATYPEFNYSKLLHLEKKKLKKLKQKTTAATNGFNDPFEVNDDDVERIAKELEKKYGNTYSSGRSRKDERGDIGHGYDETDSFIDNTEAYDENIPEEVETIEGGFYINCGALVFKKLHNEPLKTKTDEIIKMPDRPKKRILSTSSEDSSSGDEDGEDEDDDDDDEDDDEDDEEEDDSGEETAVDTTAKVSSRPIEKRHKPNGPASSSSSSVISQENGKKKDKPLPLSCSSSNSPKPLNEDIGSDSDKDRARQKMVKTTTVKDMLKAKRDNFLKMQEVGETKGANGELKGAAAKSSDEDSSSDDSSNESSDNSNSNQSAQQGSSRQNKGGLNEEGSNEKLRGADTKLPDLDNDLVASLADFKEMVKSKSLTGKRFQFDDKLTEVFLKIDESLLCIEKPQRNMVFAHLEYQLLLPKYYFLRKAKQLRIKEEKLKSKRALGKLRKAVIETMPGAIASYEVELRKAAETQSGNLNADQPPKMPKKKFPWNSNLRNLLYEVYQVRWTSYPVLGTRKETLEDFINMYMRERVVEVWPNGWMRYEELQKEIERRKASAKRAKEKKKQAVIVIGGGHGSSATVGAIGGVPCKIEESTSSGRSCANSDTDSVASSGTSNSKSTKRKSVDAAAVQKQSKAKKVNGGEQQQHLQLSYEVARKQAGASTGAGNTPLSIDLSSGPKRTDHSMTHNLINAGAATLVMVGNHNNNNNNGSNNNNSAVLGGVALAGAGTALPAFTNATKHSMATLPRLQPHVIDLDNYKTTNAILQTSKQLMQVGGGVSSAAALQEQVRRCSSESDGVEIVGVFHATSPPQPMPQAVAASLPSGKPKHKAKNNGSGGGANSRIGQTSQVNNFHNAGEFSASAYGAAAGGGNKRGLAMGISGGTVIGGGGVSLANFDAAKVVNVLKELELPQNVLSKNQNQ